MISLIGRKLSHRLVENKIISEDEFEVYAYGVEVAVSYILTFSIFILIGLLMNQAVECIIFLAAFMPIRKYAGGYHAPSHGRCLMLSCVMVVVALTVVKLGQEMLPWFVSLVIMVPVGMIIALLGPVEDANKPLDENEMKEYSYKLKRILAVEYALMVVLCLCGFGSMALPACVGWTAINLMCLSGILKLNNG